MGLSIDAPDALYCDLRKFHPFCGLVALLHTGLEKQNDMHSLEDNIAAFSVDKNSAKNVRLYFEQTAYLLLEILKVQIPCFQGFQQQLC